MRLTKPNKEKLYLRRATFWANVYQTYADSIKGDDKISPADFDLRCQSNADRALKAFDARFPMEPVQEKTADHIQIIK